MKMNSARKTTVLSILAASIAAGALLAGIVRVNPPAAAPEAKVTVGMQQSASGEQVPTVTVVAKRMSVHQKARAALQDIKDVAQASIAGAGKALAAAHRA
jgi:hypothetical protein